jgi:hypothetical protein
MGARSAALPWGVRTGAVAERRWIPNPGLLPPPYFFIKNAKIESYFSNQGGTLKLISRLLVGLGFIWLALFGLGLTAQPRRVGTLGCFIPGAGGWWEALIIIVLAGQYVVRKICEGRKAKDTQNDSKPSQVAKN